MDTFIDSLMQMLDTSSGEELVLLLVLLAAGFSILVVTLWTGVPPMPTDTKVRNLMLELMPVDPPPAVILDLGSGWGGLVLAVARAHPDARVIGIELSPLPWAWSRLRLRLAGVTNAETRLGNFMTAPLPQADLVVCYLMVRSMRRLGEKLKRELPPGTTIISNAFAIHEWKSEHISMATDAMRTFVYRYRVPVV